MASEETAGTEVQKHKVISKHDLTMLGIRSNLVQATFSYERMHAPGWTWAQLPIFKKIYKDDKKGLSTVMSENMEFINSSPPLEAILMGLLVNLEEQRAPRETIRGLKNALFGPMAGIGDAIFWFTILPIVGGIAASFCSSGNILGPILFFIVYLGIFLIRIPEAHLGYNLGLRAIDVIRDNSIIISKAASILGLTVIGALISSYVKMDVLTTIHFGAKTAISIQKDFLNHIFPNILPFGFTMFLYWMLRKKANPLWLIVVTFVVAILCAYWGIL